MNDAPQSVTPVSADETLPEGIVAVPVTHYSVGEYLYTSLADAKAEHRRRASENSPAS
jgi:hypothetical protein